MDILQKDFAEALGVSGSFLSELENGKNRPGLLFLKKMSTVFNISIDYILNGDGDPFRPIPGEPTVIPSVNDDSPDSEVFIELNYYMKNALDDDFLRRTIILWRSCVREAYGRMRQEIQRRCNPLWFLTYLKGDARIS